MERKLWCQNKLYWTSYTMQAFKFLVIPVHQLLWDKCNYSQFTVKVRIYTVYMHIHKYMLYIYLCTAGIWVIE